MRKASNVRPMRADEKLWDVVKKAQQNYCKFYGKKMGVRAVTGVWARNPEIVKMLVKPQKRIILQKGKRRGRIK